MKSTAIKSTHTDFVSCNICLRDDWASLEGSWMWVCTRMWGTAFTNFFNETKNSLINILFSHVQHVNWINFSFNKPIKHLGQICSPLSLSELKLLSMNFFFFFKAWAYLFVLFESILLGESKYFQISLEKQWNGCNIYIS